MHIQTRIAVRTPLRRWLGSVFGALLDAVRRVCVRSCVREQEIAHVAKELERNSKATITTLEEKTQARSLAHDARVTRSRAHGALAGGRGGACE
eukprot:1012177-Pleurochrysis_carterae.AAC.1